jgi:NADPH-dependent curcumin reductase CurA
MGSATTVNRRIVLARRPQGLPVPEDFRLETRPVPGAEAGRVLLRTRFLSLDPYMRGRMDEGPSYAQTVDLDGVMQGQTVSVVEASGVAAFRVGDLVVANVGWQDYGVSDGRDLVRIDPAIPQPSYALGVLGMPGLTAYVGLLDIGQPRPGETVVVSAATGAVGAVVGQIARIKGCRVVGVAGGPQKCAYAKQELGFDDCVDHHASDLPQRLAAACPKGIDVYFESVGGATLAAVLPLLSVNARIPLCGLIAWYNLEKLPTGVDRTPRLLLTALRQRLKIQGFIISDHYQRMGAFQQDMRTWLSEGRVRYREQVIAGLENAPRGLIGLLQGQNFGKLVVRVAEA